MLIVMFSIKVVTIETYFKFFLTETDLADTGWTNVNPDVSLLYLLPGKDFGMVVHDFHGSKTMIFHLVADMADF